MSKQVLSKAQFAEFLPKVIDICAQNKLATLSNGIVKSDLLKPANDHLREALKYNLPGGKMTRGLMAANIYYSLLKTEKPENWYETGLRIGWAVEALQTCFLVADDIMDSSTTRRGVPCWYKCAGLSAVNDSLTIESCVYMLLRSLPEHCQIDRLVRLFQEVTFITEQGQTLDMQNSELPKVDLDKFTTENYKAIVRYKTSVYSFYLPFAAGMLAAGYEPNCPIMEKILMEMGFYFQVQDDFLDCFGDPSVTGKIGTDIQDNKCSWLVVKALQSDQENVRAILSAHYGKKNDDDIAKIKNLYDELEIERQFHDFEDQSLERIDSLIGQYSGPLDKSIFELLKAKLYRRSQ